MEVSKPHQFKERCVMDYTTLPFAVPAPTEPLVFCLSPLVLHLRTLIDARDPRGRMYPLAEILTIAVLAKMSGQSRVRALAEWARHRASTLARFFGLKHATMPHPTTWSRILGEAVDPLLLEQTIATFLQGLPSSEVAARGSILVNLDGKTLRGTIPLGQTQGVHLLAVYQPDRGITLAQVAVGAKTNEIGAAPQLLEQLDLTGMVVTGDAMHTQRQLSIQIVEGGGDYLWFVKENQPELLATIKLLFEPEVVQAGWSAPAVDFTSATTVEQAHGRLDERTITLSSMLCEYCDWPYLAQVFKLERRSTNARGQVLNEVRYGITSQEASVADARSVLRQARGHWAIENQLHYRRDVSLHEDASQVRLGQAPQVLAALNNLVLGLWAQHGISNVPSAQRAFDYHFNAFLLHHAE